MYEKRHHPIAAKHVFFKRVATNVVIALLVFVIFLVGGMMGYHHFERLTWIEAYENAAMILSGMGPVEPMKTINGKLFAGTYALLSGIVFLVSMAIVLAPLIHRFFHHFLFEERKR